MHHGPVEQARAVAPATRMGQHRNAKFGAAFQLGIGGKGQMRHRNQLQPTVVDAENIVALKIKPIDITPDLLVVGRITKAQVTVGRAECQQMGRNALAVTGTHRADGNNHRRHGRPHSKVLRAVLCRLTEKVPTCLEGCF